MSPAELHVVTISNPFEDTPEGMAAMDRLQAAEEKHREDIRNEYGASTLAAIDAAYEQAAHMLLFGTGEGEGGNPQLGTSDTAREAGKNVYGLPNAGARG